MKHDENTFKNNGATVQVLKMSRLGFIVNLWEGKEWSQAILPTFDGSALALAILEAKGVEATDMPEDPTDWNDTEALESLSAWCLRRSVELTETKAAEAKEQAELEAEALDLYNAARRNMGWVEDRDWSMCDDFRREDWIAVARKAREMRAEK